MKILVTGGLGFIGSHTVVELQNKGFEFSFKSVNFESDIVWTTDFNISFNNLKLLISWEDPPNIEWFDSAICALSLFKESPISLSDSCTW